MSPNGYVTNVCLLIIVYTFFNAAPILLLLHAVQEGNDSQIVVLCIVAMGSAFISVCLVVVTTIYCLLSYPDKAFFEESKEMPALSQRVTHEQA